MLKYTRFLHFRNYSKSFKHKGTQRKEKGKTKEKQDIRSF
jgi:hypothetical protein